MTRMTDEEIERRMRAAKEKADKTIYRPGKEWAKFYARHLLEHANEPLPDPVEEAAEAYAKEFSCLDDAPWFCARQQGFIAGAKWQREQSENPDQ